MYMNVNPDLLIFSIIQFVFSGKQGTFLQPAGHVFEFSNNIKLFGTIIGSTFQFDGFPEFLTTHV